MGDNIHGLLFDLDNTLIDRESAFRRFATHFYEENLRDATPMAQVDAVDKDAVDKMVRWDQDGYADREMMFKRWVAEWPEAALDAEQLLP